MMWKGILRKGIISGFCLVLALPAFSQELLEKDVFAPFVSHLNGEIRNNLLRLTWTDSRDVKGPVYIYTSRNPIEGVNLDYLGKPVEVPYGAQYYVDEVAGRGLFYYYVMASDDAGRRYNVFIPFTNAISVAVSGDPGYPARDFDSLSPGESRPAVTSIKARVAGEGVTITFDAPSERVPLVLYRSVQPLRQVTDLLSAVIAGSSVNSPFTDYPVPGIPYYYTLIREDDLIRGTVTIAAGQNSTVDPVEVPLGSGRVGIAGSQNIRSMPLPIVTLQTAAPGLNIIPETETPGVLSPEAAQALAGILKANNFSPTTVQPETLKKPRAFTQDLAAPSGGEDYTIRSIVQNSFLKKDWYTAREELIRFLALPRSSATEARARFYLGQAMFFLGNYRDSLLEFLRIQAIYPIESQEWIQAILAAMTE